MDADLPPGLKSKARVKAKEKSELHFHTNCGVSLVKQLWKGTLNDDLLLAAQGQARWDLKGGGGDGVHITNFIKERMDFSLGRRPVGFPRGAAAVRRQRGVDQGCHLGHTGDKEKQEKEKNTPRRGDIWDAKIGDISLPPDGIKSTPIGKVSEKQGFMIMSYRSMMMKSEKGRWVNGIS